MIVHQNYVIYIVHRINHFLRQHFHVYIHMYMYIFTLRHAFSIDGTRCAVINDT